MSASLGRFLRNKDRRACGASPPDIILPQAASVLCLFSVINSVLYRKVTVESKIGDGRSVATRGDTQPCELNESLGGGLLAGTAIEFRAEGHPR